jgi:hypothetical protein
MILSLSCYNIVRVFLIREEIDFGIHIKVGS